jgi:hypothetical protein
VLSCFGALEVIAAPGEPSALIAYSITATDQSEVTSLEIKGVKNGYPAPLGSNIITGRATDVAGNTKECTITIKVNTDLLSFLVILATLITLAAYFPPHHA